MSRSGDRRLLFVHAHPDDESIQNGATMARYAADGVHVTVVTCTRGELGEVIPPELAHLAADGTLGDYRERELASAMQSLGVRDHRFLGADEPGFVPVRYPDSGMALDGAGRVVPVPEVGPEAFTAVDPEEPAARLAALLRQVRPQVVVTYEPGGGYGHPDHVRTHEVATRAIGLAAAEGPGGAPWAVAKFYWTVLPASLAGQALADPESNPFVAPDPAAPRPGMVVPDDEVTTRIDAEAFRGAKVAALRAHATQLAVSDDGDWFATSNGIGQPVLGTEFYRLVLGRPSGALVGDGREADLFAGLYGDAEA